ncbi:hypothetical protein [Thalassospira sp.]|uniref:hypothetical protein n=1 Tax=Thalassospira sp. TaxID=1912094 RepID=UPI0032EEF748
MHMLLMWKTIGVSVGILVLTSCQTTQYRGQNLLYYAFEQVCVAHIGDGPAMAAAVKKVLPFYTDDIKPALRDHVMRGPTVVKTRWYSLPGYGDLVVAEDGRYCRIGQFRDDAMAVLAGITGANNLETLKDGQSPNGYRRSVVRLTDSGAIVSLTEGSHANFLHMMTPDLYMAQRTHDDPTL